MNTMQLGELIKVLRKRHHMTQEDLAEKLDVTVSAVSKWETGKNLPDMDILHRLSTIFSVSIDDLYHAEDTLSVLNNPNTGNISFISKQKEATYHTLPLKKLLVVLGISTLLLLFIVGIYKVFEKQQFSSTNLYPISSRITEDEHFGTVYEVAYIYTGNPENITSTSPFIVQLSEDWAKNSSIQENIIYMKVSFYAKETDALQWNTPSHCTYVVR